MRNGSKTRSMLEDETTNLMNLEFEQAKIIFQLQSRMLDVKENYKRKYEPNLQCELCKNENENQLHIFKCEAYSDIMKEIKITETVEDTIKENNPSNVAEAVMKAIKRRDTIIERRKSI